MAIMYQDEDEAYTAWLATCPHGFVVNAERTPRQSYLILHRASCGTLHSKDRRQIHKTRDYIKICGATVPELERWLRENVTGDARLQHCSKCRPL